jgi:phosphate acetyltransferase
MITNKLFDEIHIGDSASMERTLTKRDLDMFAVLSGDMNPTHLSDEYAQMLLQRQKVAGHSMWAGTLISSVLGNDLPGPGTVYRSQNFEFHNAVDLGDTIVVTVTAKEKLPDGKTITFDCLAENQRKEKIITGVAEVYAPNTKVTGEGILEQDMTYRRRHAFQDLIEKCRDLEPISVAVCHPCSETALAGAIEAAQLGLIRPVLVGPRQRIVSLAETAGYDISPYEIIDSEHSHQSAEKAVKLCRMGETEALMKGSLHTDEMMGAVVKGDTGLRTASRISHVFVIDVPTYPRPLFITDAAINIFPNLEDKVHILNNAVDLAHALEIAEPKVAILSAVETINPKIPSTLEAAALCKMADRGQIVGAIVDGPLAFDNAISKEAATIKGIESKVAGEADIFLVPDLEAGNMLAKQLAYLVDADAAGIVLGARVPIVLTSRADSAKARLASCAVAAALAHARRRGQKEPKGVAA